MKLLSFDPAVNNMGVIIIEINDNPPPKIKNYDKESIFAFLQESKTYIDEYIKIVYAETWNLSSEKKIDISKIAFALKNKINEIEKYGPFDHVIYEFQMSANDKSRAISEFIIYHFAPNAKKIEAGYKNTIHHCENCKMQIFIKKYNSSYKANKEHAKAVFAHFTGSKLIGKYDDISDAFCNGIAFLIKEKILM